MNALDFSIKAGWPESTETWEYLQKMIFQLQKVALLGGNNYILAGCINVGGIISDGVVVINGEVLEFVGGAVQADVIITDTVVKRDFFGGANNPYYHNRKATFGIGAGSIAWNSFEVNDPTNGVLARLASLTTALTALTNTFNNHTHAWSDITNKPPGYVSYLGSQNLGDVGVNGRISDNNSSFTIPIPDQGTTNYVISGCLVGLGGNADNDNDVMWVLSQRAADSFKIVIREASPLTQNLSFDFAIIKSI